MLSATNGQAQVGIVVVLQQKRVGSAIESTNLATVNKSENNATCKSKKVR